MHVLWTVDASEAPLWGGSHSVVFDTPGFDTSWTGLEAVSASFLNNCPADCAGAGVNGPIPVGKGAFFRRQPTSALDSAVGIDNAAGIIGSFFGAVNFFLPPVGETIGLPVGTYTVGTIIWDVSGAEGAFVDIDPFLDLGDGFPKRDAVDGSFILITDITLNGASLNMIPEPGTAALLGLGLIGLTAVIRRRNG